ncbi:efflux RND transporter periplasmic adaptor subunit [Desulfofustis glycolicus]|uniref:HlyD family secretion protein n=1 Tax=Desulfofustis glycolicus DSM 9705 TaxID=1121409 RepID=A0A1M5UP99_9BACT|nr:efflux RND transporter periplasmic adaptor subunit [Desulfofustis glycolicus]MCB2217377.1 efflux RND transporter periplasmic adaptor subunit [Desulfobulbaceae bacterium]SHH64726.1 HlyD family secretion protein [Desulfofustis glycolicus DSM 9705]
MRKSVWWLIVLLIGAGLAGLIWQQTRPKPVPVSIKPVMRGAVEKTVANTRAGTVEACRRARLSPSIGGQIAVLPIREGDQVAAGDLLLEIWNDDLQAQLEVARQEAAVAEAQAEAHCRRSEEAQRQAERATTLYKQKIGSIEQTELAVTEAAALNDQCRAGRASAERARAQIELARANLTRSRLIAPFGGVIAKIEGELNEFVTPSPVGVMTPPVVDLIENTCFYVTAPIDEVDGAAVRIGMVARITLDAYRDREFSGTVRRIAPYVLDLEKQARTVDVEVAFDHPEDFAALLAGYSADVEIILQTRSDTLMIPSEAVQEGNTVYRFDETEQRVSRVTFTPGLSNWVVTEVVSGLEEGAQVVINVDHPDLADGVPATISNQNQ